MLLTLLLDPHYPSNTVSYACLGLLLAWVVLVGWSLVQVVRGKATRKRGLLGLGVAAVVWLLAGKLLQWGLFVLVMLVANH